MLVIFSGGGRRRLAALSGGKFEMKHLGAGFVLGFCRFPYIRSVFFRCVAAEGAGPQSMTARSYFRRFVSDDAQSRTVSRTDGKSPASSTADALTTVRLTELTEEDIARAKAL